jgi:HAMP domain-containing protein
MAKKTTHSMNAHVARLLMAAFAAIILLGAAAAFSIGFTGALERDFGSPASTIERLAAALVWAQAAALVTLSLLCFVLFALAWYLRERLIAPLEKLRRSLAATAAGAGDEPIWGLTRRDEIGALARAAESLRTAAEAPGRLSLGLAPEAAERLTRGAERLEQHLVAIPEIAEKMRERVEEASLRAAKASHVAAESAALTRQVVTRIEESARPRTDAPGQQTRESAEMLVEATKRLSETIALFEARMKAADGRSTSDDFVSRPLPLFVDDDFPSHETFPTLPAARDFARSGQRPVIEVVAVRENASTGAPADATIVLEGLVDNLDALERYASERKAIAEDEAVAFMATLIEAIDRLNSVADRICATADESAIRAAE